MNNKLRFSIIALVVSLIVVFLAVRDIDLRSSFGTIAYIQYGNVWVRSLPHGEPRQLTDDGLGSRPLLSATGAWLAFRKGKNQVWLVRTNGRDGRPLPHKHDIGNFKWAPASDRLAYAVNGELWIVEAGKNEPRRLVPGPQREWEGVREILWSPDEQSLAYEYVQQREVPEGEWPWRTSISQVQTQTGTCIDLITFPSPNDEGVPGNIQLAAWRGARKYFWQCEILSASIMADGCPFFYLDAANRQIEVGVSSLLAPDFFAFAPDLKTLAMVEGRGRETGTGKRLQLIDLESGAQKTLTAPRTAAMSPAWSPDGSHLVYVAGPDIGISTSNTTEREILEGIQKRRVWIVKADGTERRPLTKDEGYQEERPMFLTDKKHLILARVNTSGEASLWLMRNDGRALEQVAAPVSLPNESRSGYYGQISWNEVFDCTSLKLER
jgi:hypothetical protein